MNFTSGAQLVHPGTAFIFDLNGTMIDDMAYHNQAWFDILTKELGVSITFDEVKKELYGKNNELLVRVFGKDRFTEEEMDEISVRKERQYQESFRPHLHLIPGLEEFLKKSHDHKVPMAIGSAAILFNVDYVLDNLSIRKYFPVTVSADDVAISKPHPETFLKASERLAVRPENCIVFEDSPKGVEAAWNAGMLSVVITTMHEAHEFDKGKGVIAFIHDYNDPFVKGAFGGDNMD